MATTPVPIDEGEVKKALDQQMGQTSDMDAEAADLSKAPLPTWMKNQLGYRTMPTSELGQSSGSGGAAGPADAPVDPTIGVKVEVEVEV